MEKKIEDYLHLYLGCRVIFPSNGQANRLVAIVRNQNEEVRLSTAILLKVKPILRPLSDMTKEEAIELIQIGTSVYNFIGIREVDEYEVMYDGGYPTSRRTWLFHLRFSELKAEQFQFLLSKHFDLFGLIEAGLAIDATTITELSKKCAAIAQQHTNAKLSELEKLISALEKYNKCLTDELNDVVSIAFMHGWKSNRFKEGESLRQEISKLKEKIN